MGAETKHGNKVWTAHGRAQQEARGSTAHHSQLRQVGQGPQLLGQALQAVVRQVEGPEGLRRRVEGW